MAVSDTQPISAANLKAALESFAGGGLFRETLFAGGSHYEVSIIDPTGYEKLLVEFSEGRGYSPRYLAEIEPVKGAVTKIQIKKRSSYLRVVYNQGDTSNDPSWGLSIDNMNWVIVRVVGYLKL